MEHNNSKKTIRFKNVDLKPFLDKQNLVQKTKVFGRVLVPNTLQAKAEDEK